MKYLNNFFSLYYINLFTIVLLGFIFSSCAAQSYSLSKNIIENGDFSKDSLVGWGVEAISDSSIQIINDSKSKKRIAKFTLSSGERVNNGHRVEIKKVNCALPGTEWQYEFSFMLDSNYTFSPYIQIIQQFHDYPNFSKGETWRSYKGNPPVVSFTIINEECILFVNNMIKKSDRVGKFRVEKNHWYNIRLQSKWSLDKDGYIEAFVNNKAITKHNGTDYKYYTPTLLNNEGNYFKLGMYFDDRITMTNSIYYADIKIRQIIRSTK